MPIDPTTAKLWIISWVVATLWIHGGGERWMFSILGGAVIGPVVVLLWALFIQLVVLALNLGTTTATPV